MSRAAPSVVELARLPLEDLLLALDKATEGMTPLQRALALIRTGVLVSHQSCDYEGQRLFASALFEIAAREGARSW